MALQLFPQAWNGNQGKEPKSSFGFIKFCTDSPLELVHLVDFLLMYYYDLSLWIKLKKNIISNLMHTIHAKFIRRFLIAFNYIQFLHHRILSLTNDKFVHIALVNGDLLTTIFFFSSLSFFVVLVLSNRLELKCNMKKESRTNKHQNGWLTVIEESWLVPFQGFT